MERAGLTEQYVEQMGDVRQGFAINDRRAGRALDGTCPAAKKPCQEGEGSYCERVSARKSLTAFEPFQGEGQVAEMRVFC